MLAAAMNPCPCGYLGDPRRSCSCAPLLVERYLSRVSGPLLDRIDIHIDVPAVPHQELSYDRSGDSSGAIRERVAAARQRQLERFSERPGIYANAHMGPRDLAPDRRVSQAYSFPGYLQQSGPVRRLYAKWMIFHPSVVSNN